MTDMIAAFNVEAARAILDNGDIPAKVALVDLTQLAREQQAEARAKEPTSKE
jgi:hypothetical protein